MKTAFIIGLGNIGLYYDLHLDSSTAQTHSRAITLSEDFELVGGADQSEISCQLFRTHYGKPAFVEWEEGISILCPDLVIVSSSTRTHCEVIKRLLEICKPKGILCEKPLGGSAEAGRKIVKRCAESSVPIWVNFIRRSDPAVRRIKNMIEEKEVEGPFRGFCWYTKGLIHNGSHFIALLVYWFGPIRNWQLIHESDLQDGDKLAPAFVIRFNNATIHVSPAWGDSFEHHSIELLSRSCRIRYDRGGWDVKLEKVCRREGQDGVLESKAIRLVSDMDRYQLNVLKELARSLHGEAGEITSGQEAVAVLEYIEQIIGSI